ncbi:carboxypeptidase S [Pleurotus eryngii]|uniref:Carboxypeptidase S n=1 Tax=Pleurotus eryngii TaxID=5323 RepID=A0A9P6AC52_PLEER|nr:carboxypeptidase S [Pleurotus eryngii]
MGQTATLEDIDGGQFARARARTSRSHRLHLLLVVVFVGAYLFGHRCWHHASMNQAPVCPQTEALVPTQNNGLWSDISALVSTDSFEKYAAELLGGAVRIRGETFDSMGPVGQDPRWKVHTNFHEYLEQAFPQIHKALKLETVNTYGLLYTWQGSATSLKPLLMMAHLDTVPVNPDTIESWTHPPWSGYFDGTSIWGRGASDDKSGLIGTMAAIELLLQRGFQPLRTVVLAFGFDEEAGGVQGAGHIAPVLLDRYGADSFAAIIDEGGGFSEEYGTIFAGPGVAEKGSMNVELDVTAPGGHSSIPPSHTSIGLLAAAIVHLEDHPFDVHLDRKSTIYARLQCAAQHGKEMGATLRRRIRESLKSDKKLRNLETLLFADSVEKSLAGTTQAIDLINGGVKSNALPEQARAVINHRIDSMSSSNVVKERDTTLLKEIAHKFNLSYIAFGHEITEKDAPSAGTISISSPLVLEPAPVTPIVMDRATPYGVLSGSIRATYNARRSQNNQDGDIFVTPGMPTGNTDTRYYWGLTSHIFRYTHHDLGTSNNPLGGGVHTVNEHIETSAFLEMIRFYVTFILNMQESLDV